MLIYNSFIEYNVDTSELKLSINQGLCLLLYPNGLPMLCNPVSEDYLSGGWLMSSRSNLSERTGLEMCLLHSDPGLSRCHERGLLTLGLQALRLQWGTKLGSSSEKHCISLFSDQLLKSRLPVETKVEYRPLRRNLILSLSPCFHDFLQSRLQNASGIPSYQNKCPFQLNFSYCVYPHLKPKAWMTEHVYQRPDSQCLQPGRIKGARCLFPFA